LDDDRHYIIADLGHIHYSQAYSIQRDYLEQVKAKKLNGVLLFAEHDPVFTLGKAANRDNLIMDKKTLEAKGIDVIVSDRGGDVTFHGPGQLVIYPIFDLTRHGKDTLKFLRDLEEVAIRTLSEFGILSFREAGKTGVWTDNGKIASIGIGISRWVSYHGMSINANVDLSYFDMIHPCGMKDISVTSIKEIKGEGVNFSLLKTRIVRHFVTVFSIKL